MNWDAIGAIGQMLGSLAVFITLIYLTIQTRQTREDVRRSVSQSRAGGSREIFLAMFNNARFSEVSGRVRPPAVEAAVVRGGMSEPDAWMTYWLAHAWWQYRTQVIGYINELPAGERFGFDAGCRQAYSEGGLQRVWYESQKLSLNPDVVRYVDNLLAQPG